MSTDDFAIYEGLPFGREDAFERIFAVFTEHRVRFSGMARGAVWDPPIGFSYVFDQDNEDLGSPRDALNLAADWQGLIIDFDRDYLNFELHFFHGAAPRRHLEAVCFRYNQRDLFIQMPARVEGLRNLIQDVGLALGSVAMVCGSQLDTAAYTASDLEDVFARHVATPVDRDRYNIHTVFFCDDVFQRLVGAPGLASYGRRTIGPGYQVASLLLPAPHQGTPKMR
jgi:hypothetical protein